MLSADRRRRQPSARQIGRRIKVQDHARVIDVNQEDAFGYRINHNSRTLVFWCRHQFRKDRLIENHRMAAALSIASDYDRTT